MAEADSLPSDAEGPEPVSFAEFLEAIPPNRPARVVGLGTTDTTKPNTIVFNKSDIQLHCSSELCNGIRFFGIQLNKELKPVSTHHFLTYVCRNCRRMAKVYAIWAHLIEDMDGEAYKFGEAPPFGPPTPPRVIKVIGPDRELFLMGRRAENQELGIGAFAYYRRVVENQKSRLIQEIIRVSEKIGAKETVLSHLQAARDETQFSKAIEKVKDAMPETLLINGHNPLVLLHNALSEGLHAKADRECLEIAKSIRVVLSELADRLGSALKDEAELNAAVSRLMKPRP